MAPGDLGRERGENWAFVLHIEGRACLCRRAVCCERSCAREDM
jgi:hypothetical protein